MKKTAIAFTLIATIITASVLVGFSPRKNDEPQTNTVVKAATYSAAANTTAQVNTFTFAPSTTMSSIYDNLNLTSNDDDKLVLSFLGDSVTRGYLTTKAYEYFVGEYMDADVVNNYGISSTTVSTGSGHKVDQAFINRYTDISEDSDLIFVFGGSNDWSHDTVLGSLGDTSLDTFYGAYDYLISSILEEYPDATLVVATPIHRIDEYPDYGFYYDEDGIYRNSNGDSLEDFVTAVQEIAAKYNVTCIDLYHCDECDFSSDTEMTTYWTDGVHPNAYGDEILAKHIYSVLSTLDL